MTSNTQIGRHAEELAWEHLSRQGYRLVERNFRGRFGEVDLIAWDQDVLCFVEVRSRSSTDHGDPLESIDRRKINRIGKAAYEWLESYRGDWPQMRFDAIGVVLEPSIVVRLEKGAFEL